MSKGKNIIFLGDGMADEPIPELNGLTPLQYAKTPAMDHIAQQGVSGTLLTLPDGFPTSSEVANMSVLGCDLSTEYCGRGPLEAVGRNIELAPDDVAFRLNLTTVKDDILKDFSGGHINQEDANALISALNNYFGCDSVRFHAGVSYRNILVLSGRQYSHLIHTDKPDDNHNEPVSEHLPVATDPQAKATQDLLRRIIKEAPIVLETCPVNKARAAQGKPMANGVWPWSGGKAGSLRTLKEKFGITGAVVSAVDVIIGLGKCLGLDVIRVQGATGYTDTNYEGKARAAIDALATRDFVYVHLEAIDEVSHEQNLQKKIETIEAFDARIIGPVLSAFDNNLNAVVLPDHPVPIAIGKHTRTPVPVSARIRNIKPDSVSEFNEVSCAKGSLGAMANGDLMNLIFRK
ncbi:MAG: cofactor-independent phosphoglycerate mutase [Lentisphaerae bacterium]|nr:cofactor-independent phosphoglycerate mutase [Lentisphaerota bacterium]